jgi:uncharacterized protein YgiM (DUF1202 family)
MLLSLILSLSFACTSTPDENASENVSPEAEVPASVAAKPETDVKDKAADSNDVAAAVEAKLDAKAEVAPVAVPAPAVEASQPAAVVASEKLVYPTASLVNVRQGPGKSHAVSRVAKFGEAISLTGEMKNTWLKTTDGLWVSSLFTTENKPAQANDPAVQAAPAVSEVEAPQAVESAEPAAVDTAAPAQN